MSVASKNLFALLDDDAQDVSPSTVAKQETAPESPPSANRSQNQQRGRGPASRGGRYYQRGAKSSSNVDTSAENHEENGSAESRKKRDGDQRGRGRGGRGGRGRGRGGGRGREFDRHSGTLPDSEKRVHQGWGGDDGDRELQTEQAAVADVKAEVSATGGDWAGETTAGGDWAGETTGGGNWAGETTGGADWADAGERRSGDWGAAPAATDSTPTADAKETSNEHRRRRIQDDDEDDNTLTLEQYLAQKNKQPSFELPKLEGLRMANEGSDESLWKNAVHNGKVNEVENYFIGKVKSAPKAKAKKAEKEFIEIEARFERPGRGGRGGRGRGEDRRGRGNNRGARQTSRNTATEVDVADETAFPSLS